MRATCSAQAQGNSTYRGMVLDQVMLLLCLEMPPPENNLHFALNEHADFLSANMQIVRSILEHLS